MEIMTVQIKKTKVIMQFRILEERGGRWFNGEKKAEKKKRWVVVALFTQFQHLIFSLYDLSLHIFFSYWGQ